MKVSTEKDPALIRKEPPDILVRRGTCRHYFVAHDPNASLSTLGKPACHKGVDLSGLKISELPCTPSGPRTCPHREEYTEAEVKEYEAWRQHETRRGMLVYAAIPQSGRGTHGDLECPSCGNLLQWSRAASNGHLHARCRTPMCFAVMQ